MAAPTRIAVSILRFGTSGAGEQKCGKQKHNPTNSDPSLDSKQRLFALPVPW
jgi:hypothetical protein